MRLLISLLVMCSSFLMLSCRSDSKDDSSDSRAGSWTGYIKCSTRGSDTYVNPPYFPTIITINNDKSFSLTYYYNGKEAQKINGTIDDQDGTINASVYTDLSYDDSASAKAVFKFSTTIGSNGVATGTYSVTYDNSTIGVTSDESGTITVTSESTGIVGTWYGGYQGTDSVYDGFVKVVFLDDGTFTATHFDTESSSSDFSFVGTYSLAESSFNAASNGQFSGTVTSHTGTYTASKTKSILINAEYTVNTGTAYTGYWALAKELQ